MEIEEAIELCNEILEDLQDLPEAAEEFAESVEEKVTGILEYVESRDFVTQGQEIALRNMRRGLDKWL